MKGNENVSNNQCEYCVCCFAHVECDQYRPLSGGRFSKTYNAIHKNNSGRLQFEINLKFF